MTDERAIQPASDFTADEIAAILTAHGVIDEQTEWYTRMKVDGTNYVAGENEIWVGNPKTNEPAFVARILQPPEQYQSFFFTDVFATQAGRPEMAGKFCRSYYNNPAENREFGTNGASCRACIFKPFGDSQNKCSWKGDLHIQPIPDDGIMKGDERIYTLTLTTTGMVQWKGTRRNQNAGSVTDENTMFALARLALQKAPEWGMSNEEAITTALTALNSGYVAAEFRAIRAHNEKNGQSWSVPVITPIHIELPPDDIPAIEGGDTPSA